ncbi:DUF2179 domain-containing protein [Heliobacterium undosum]|uniref:UPF0316 protein GTO91_07560 n=1 Tax=Heliomicrobium undosum TaxID=121734 RepID=A0A845L9G5_9FIRM|nr:DUF5698 domain-containing protein [Heliomicrobium undosum]MZP29561.1 DUF2179 domain-containing protein [Heliomicrobium undosum]
MTIELIVGYFVVFFARILDVSMMTLRTLMAMRGNKAWAAAFGTVEVLVYITVLKYLINTLDDPVSLIFYALGFAAGNVVGIWIEEKLAFGFLTMQVITMEEPFSFTDSLRGRGFGLTLFPCQGRDGCHHTLNIVFERKRLKELEKLIRDWDANAFITVLDTRTIRGGHFRATRK